MSLAADCFAEHVASFPFQEGVTRGWWGLVDHPQVQWPHVLAWIAAPVRGGGPDRFHLRFHLSDYPTVGPTAGVWDLVNNCSAPAAQRPKGTHDVAIAFRTDWKEGLVLYVPWDRVAWDDHIKDWPGKHPGFQWKATDTITRYFQYTRDLLHSPEYTG